MRSLLVLIVVSIDVIFLSQHVKAKEEIYNDIKSKRQFEKDLREVKDLWNNIKSSAENAWKSIKYISQKTKEKISSWVNNVKIRANDVSKEFEVRIKDMKERCHKIIEGIVGKGQLVKQCIKDDNERLEKILKHIIQHVTSCISENILKLSMLDEHQYRLEYNDTNFIDEVEKKLYRCADDTENIEECIYTVKKEMFDDMNNMEEDNLRTRSESRSVADDLLDSIMRCSIDGLIDSSANITIEALQIIKCVIKG